MRWFTLTGMLNSLILTWTSRSSGFFFSYGCFWAQWKPMYMYFSVLSWLTWKSPIQSPDFGWNDLLILYRRVRFSSRGINSPIGLKVTSFKFLDWTEPKSTRTGCLLADIFELYSSATKIPVKQEFSTVTDRSFLLQFWFLCFKIKIVPFINIKLREILHK